MTSDKIAKAEAEAKRFLMACKVLREADGGAKWLLYGSKESGAVRRSSLDLTRCLAEMRKP